MVELVDTRDLKSLDLYRSYGFDSRSGHSKHHLFIRAIAVHYKKR